MLKLAVPSFHPIHGHCRRFRVGDAFAQGELQRHLPSWEAAAATSRSLTLGRSSGTSDWKNDVGLFRTAALDAILLGLTSLQSQCHGFIAWIPRPGRGERQGPRLTRGCLARFSRVDRSALQGRAGQSGEDYRGFRRFRAFWVKG